MTERQEETLKNHVGGHMQRKGKKYIPALRFNFFTPLYDTVMKHIMHDEKFKSALIEQAAIRPGYHVLDFGCGTATLTIMAKEKCLSAKIIGVDIDEDIAEIARKKIASRNLDLRIDTYDGNRLPYEDGAFDRIISCLVMHHIPKDRKGDVLKELFRTLKAGGEIHIADFGVPRNPVMRSISFFLKLFEPLEDNIEGRIPALLEDAGFSGAREAGYHNTVFGTVALYSARKA